MKKFAFMGISALALALGAAPAFAQKSKDTLRVAFVDPISSIDLFYDPKPETSFLTRGVFEALVEYDPQEGKVVPALAQSWTRIDDTTLEFKLRKDVKFHDGSVFDADDVVHTIGWMIDPNVRLRFKSNFTWMERVEKIDSHTVRIHAKSPVAIDLVRLAVSASMLPSDVHGAYKDKSDFGRKPVGTGPYRAASVDPNSGAVLVKSDSYTSKGSGPEASIGRIHAMPIPEIQTQIAHFIRNEVDLLHSVPKDQMQALLANPNNRVTPSQGLVYYYMSFDAAGRSGLKALQDVRVRKAIEMALDRESIVKNILDIGGAVKPIDNICFKIQQACDYTLKPPAYDPVAAKKLLAEAGYPEGFDLEITTFPGVYELAEVVAGELRKVGIRTIVDKRTMATYRKKQSDGEIQALVGLYSSGGLPDASALLNYYFSNNARDYYRDAQLSEWAKLGERTIDPEKRRAIYRKGFDRMNEMAYVLPIANAPTYWIHTKDLKVIPGSLAPMGGEPAMVHWAK